MTIKLRARTAIAFFGIWIGILYAGADHPPPIGFWWLVALVFVCAVAVYMRLPVYESRSSRRSPGRARRVLRDGLLAGLVVGLVPLMLPFTGEPTTASASVTPILIWLATLSALGILNAVLVYIIAAVVPSESRATTKP